MSPIPPIPVPQLLLGTATLNDAGTVITFTPNASYNGGTGVNPFPGGTFTYRVTDDEFADDYDVADITLSVNSQVTATTGERLEISYASAANGTEATISPTITGPDGAYISHIAGTEWTGTGIEYTRPLNLNRAGHRKGGERDGR